MLASRFLEVLNIQRLVEAIGEQSLRQGLKNGDKRVRKMIEDDYCQKTGHFIKKARWVDEQHGIYLMDGFNMKPCILFPLQAQPHLVTQQGTSQVYKPPCPQDKTSPQLNCDVLYSIFRYLQPADLLKCRVVCKTWCGLIETTNSLWSDKYQVAEALIPQWRHLSASQEYVQHAFVAVKHPDALVRFFVKYPLFFRAVFDCDLVRTNGTYRGITMPFRVACWSRRRKVWIPMDEDIVWFQEDKQGPTILCNVGPFLCKYRKRIEKKK